MVCRRAEWVSKLSSVDMFCCDSMVSTVIKWCSSEADVNICLPDKNLVCISTTQWITGWSNVVASLDQNIAHVAFELWNDLHFGTKATPRNFRGSFVLNNWKLSNNLWCHGSVVVIDNSQNRIERLLQQLWVVCVFAKWCIVRWRYVW